MLVLTRKPNQQLTIGNDIVITVVKVRGNTIRLGIEAPRDVRVIRSELEVHIDQSLTADLELADDDCILTPCPAESSAVSGSIMSGDASIDRSNTSATSGADDRSPDHRPLASAAPRQSVAGSIGSGQYQKMGSTMQSRAAAASNPAAPLRGFKSCKSSTTKSQSLNQLSNRNFEDSPMCHRPSTSDRAVTTRVGGIQALTSQKSR